MKSILLLGAAAAMLAAAPSARAADDSAVMKRLDRLQKVIEAQQKQIEAQKDAIDGLNRALGRKVAATPEPVAVPAPPPPVVETRLRQQDQKIEDLVAKFAAEQDAHHAALSQQARADVNDGRLTVTSADGRFSAALRMITQYDMGYYMQSAHARGLPLGPDLSSGGNFRRAQIGLQGKVFGDWSYGVRFDFGSGGSNGSESPGRIQQAYIEYDGLAPFAFRIGSHSASSGIDDSDPSPDLILLEHSGPSDLARSMASGPRYSTEMVYLGEQLFGSVALTGDKVGSTGAFDEQQAVVTRLSYSPIASEDWRWVVSAGGTDIFKVAGGGAAPNAARPFTLKNSAELVVDDSGTAFVSVADTNVTDAWNWQIESAVRYDGFLAQAGYFKFGIDQRGMTVERGQGFDGWYAEGSWVLTGEHRGWSTANGSFTNPRPEANFGEGRGAGAWELAARYSSLDLNDHAGVVGAALPPDGVRGGLQRIGTVGLNWYPNPVLKFTLQFQNVQVSRIGTNSAVVPNAANASLGQNFDTVALRSQIAF